MDDLDVDQDYQATARSLVLVYSGCTECIGDEVRARPVLFSKTRGLGNLVGINEIFPRGEVISYQDGQYTCIANDILSFLCESLVPVFETVDNPVLVGHFPAGSALKQVAHFGQNIDSVRFQRWDFGSLQNLFNYGTRNAPTYDLSRVTAKTVLHYSLADTLVGEEDVFALNGVLTDSEVRKVERTDFNHFDFGWAEDAKELVYDFIIQYIENVQTNM
ncbi:Lipase 1 [Eumeta japonica]|uniref:Lipase 1 n=1 Tax=Eumeta variegata TaxID=151549 RepID=A0A4C1VY95_EUMVA|nr:Lipase 1 [Eumeta japonica]